MHRNSRIFRGLFASAALALAALACALGGGSQNPPPADGAGSNPLPGEIVIQGDLDLRYTPAFPMVSSVVDTLIVALVDSDGASGVALFIPADIQPGTYPIGDLFNLAGAEVTARYDHLAGDDSRYYESTTGTLVLTETGDSLSGSFTFTALRTPDGSASITAEGSFGPIPGP